MPNPKPRPLVVAIDGPAGSGKSTVAKGVARALGLGHLDTGAMYRALTARALEEGVEPTDGRALAALAGRMRFEFTAEGLLVDGVRVGRGIRARRVNLTVSAVSAHPAVRKQMVRIQKQMLRAGGLVAEGRDIGTVVAPRAPVKVFLTASIEERARRRHLELDRSVPMATLRREIAVRDRLDSTREHSPLLPADDAIVLDSTGLTAEQVTARIVELARDSVGDETPAAR